MTNLNLSKLTNRLQRLRGEAPKRTSVFWTPKLPKGESSIEYQVYLLPFPDQDDYPFKERWFYFELGKMKDKNGDSIKDKSGRFIKAPLANKQFGEPDPVKDLIDQLMKTEGKSDKQIAQDKDDAKKLFANQSTFIPVIVKGEEELGPRLWRITAKSAYDRLVELFIKSAKNDKLKDLNDPKGDIWLTLKIVEVPDRPFPMNKKISSIDPEYLEREPLSEDSDQIEKWLDTVPDLDEALKYQKYDYEGLKEILTLWTESTTSDDKDEDDGSEGGKSKKAKSKKSSKKKSVKNEEDDEPKTKEEIMEKLKKYTDDDETDDED